MDRPASRPTLLYSPVVRRVALPATERHPLSIAVTAFFFVIISCLACWGTLCLTAGLARRSWTDLLAVGLIVTLGLEVLVRPFPKLAVTLAAIINGGYLLLFLGGVFYLAWSKRHTGSDG